MSWECHGSVTFKLSDVVEHGAFLSLFATFLFCVNNCWISLLKWFWHKNRDMLFVSFTVVHRFVLPPCVSFGKHSCIWDEKVTNEALQLLLLKLCGFFFFLMHLMNVINVCSANLWKWTSELFLTAFYINFSICYSVCRAHSLDSIATYLCYQL